MKALMMLALTYMMTYQLKNIGPDNRFHASCEAAFKNNDNQQYQLVTIIMQNITKFPTIDCKITKSPAVV